MPAFLVLALDDQRLAVPAAGVRQVLRMVAVTPLPGAPAGVEGAISLHGTPVPVLDLRTRLGRPPREPLLEDQLVVVQRGAGLVALHVDRALEVLEVAGADVAPAGAWAEGAGLVAGALRLPTGLLVVHDVERFLAPGEEARLQEVLQREAPAGRPPP